MAAERQMVDTVIATRVVGTAEDPETGKVVDVTVTLYEGRAKRQTYEAYEQTPQGGAHVYVVQRYTIHFPVGSFVPAPGDIATWTASVLDPDLPGTVDRITGLFNKSMATSMRVYAEETVA